jgi:hypothetical protein
MASEYGQISASNYLMLLARCNAVGPTEVWTTFGCFTATGIPDSWRGCYELCEEQQYKMLPHKGY